MAPSERRLCLCRPTQLDQQAGAFAARCQTCLRVCRSHVPGHSDGGGRMEQSFTLAADVMQKAVEALKTHICDLHKQLESAGESQSALLLSIESFAAGRSFETPPLLRIIPTTDADPSQLCWMQFLSSRRSILWLQTWRASATEPPATASPCKPTSSSRSAPALLLWNAGCRRLRYIDDDGGRRAMLHSCCAVM